MKRGIYLARDKDSALYGYNRKPTRCKNMFVLADPSGSSMILQRPGDPHQRFPEVTWENSPVFAELDLML